MTAAVKQPVYISIEIYISQLTYDILSIFQCQAKALATFNNSPIYIYIKVAISYIYVILKVCKFLENSGSYERGCY